MKEGVLLATVCGGAMALAGLIWTPDTALIWNRSASAPQGLYAVSAAAPERGDWAVIRSQSAAAQWAEGQGYVGKDWPLLKQVRGVEGDVVCRHGHEIFLNVDVIGDAREKDAAGRALPVWAGCIVLERDVYFLMNAHPDSLDGRYFGVTPADDVSGVAQPLLLVGE